MLCRDDHVWKRVRNLKMAPPPNRKLNRRRRCCKMSPRQCAPDTGLRFFCTPETDPPLLSDHTFRRSRTSHTLAFSKTVVIAYIADCPGRRSEQKTAVWPMARRVLVFFLVFLPGSSIVFYSSPSSLVYNYTPRHQAPSTKKKKGGGAAMRATLSVYDL